MAFKRLVPAVVANPIIRVMDADGLKAGFLAGTCRLQPGDGFLGKAEFGIAPRDVYRLVAGNASRAHNFGEKFARSFRLAQNGKRIGGECHCVSPVW